jgi:hypothetical protein
MMGRGMNVATMRGRAGATLAVWLFAACSDDGLASGSGGDTAEVSSGAEAGDDPAGATPATDASGTAAGSDDGPAGDDTTGSGTLPGETEGVLSVLTYNVAGLPEPLSGSMPVEYTPMISPLLNAYDLVLVQEDFAYHDELVADVDHPYQSEPKVTGEGDPLGDGLNRLSRHPFEDHMREAWEVCFGQIENGSDCLTMKGFSVARHELSPGVLVDVYNLHMDAGGSPDDLAAREAQTEQLLAAIATRSEGMALVVAGDTNMGESSEAIFQTLLEGAGLRDACRELDCGEEMRIDRIMVRDSEDVVLTPDAWRIDETFVTARGEPLSDHEAVAIDLHWAVP